MEKNDQMSESFLLASLLAIVGGFLDAYSYVCRDHVFANAQTGNIVKLGMSIAQGDSFQTVKYLIPILAFFLGVFITMFLRYQCMYQKWLLNAKLNKKKNKENSQNKRKSLIKVNE
ncbi:hypothetical protein B5E48_13250 [Massilimicrobiota sp. An105]|uniref:YoaK family protein n=1 Tax=Massilimicrobiota sp. An105 TaxID=1965540 RepID=UPI000B36DB2C|nr:YoaK family protein [Massilimicrobiota sp. An105]OUQ74212.1 hypothetical protein B5E48_13250 [Massilimicrobiota sp. An105]